MLFAKMAVACVLLAILFAPKYFLRLIDRMLEEDRPEFQVYLTEPSTVVQMDPNTDGEMDRYQRLQEAYNSAPNPTMRKIWEHQLALMERTLRWRRLEEFAGGTTR